MRLLPRKLCPLLFNNPQPPCSKMPSQIFAQQLLSSPHWNGSTICPYRYLYSREAICDLGGRNCSVVVTNNYVLQSINPLQPWSPTHYNPGAQPWSPTHTALEPHHCNPGAQPWSPTTATLGLPVFDDTRTDLLHMLSVSRMLRRY